MDEEATNEKVFENSTKLASNVCHQTGFIYTSFPECQSPNFEGITDFPESYCRLTSKEVIAPFLIRPVNCETHKFNTFTAFVVAIR